MDPNQNRRYHINFESFSQDKGFTKYTINVLDHVTKEEWYVYYRFSEMREFMKQIKKIYKGNLPKFPSRKLWGNKAQSFVAKRQKKLQLYFS